MSKTFWGILAAIVVIFVLVFTLTHHGKSNTTGTASNAKPTEHIVGNGKAGITLVEYGDYECPYCEEYASVVNQVVQDEYNNITFQFRNFPLTSIHPNAFAGARAAEAAGLMGKFWQMHDALYNYSNWKQWSTASNPVPYFDQYARQLGLNLTTFEADFNSSQVDNMITADMAAGNKLNIQGTPTFFLDGKQISVAPQASAFEKLINQAIANKGKVTNTSSGATVQTKK
jgi:protein-disulfide isomerase